MKAKLREVNFIFHIRVGGQVHDWRQVIVQVGILRGQLEITFSLPGLEGGETIAESVIEGIQDAVAWARKNVKARDLVEMDPPETNE